MNCSYDGRNRLDARIERMVRSSEALAACPEMLGGLGAPRERSEVRGGDGEAVLAGRAKAVTISGRDISRFLVNGAGKTLRLAGMYGIKKAVLKSKSPSCGCGLIYDGTFTGRLKKGDGVTASLLKKNGIQVLTEKYKNLKRADK